MALEPIVPPTAGLIAMRIGQEFGPPAEFAASLDGALARGGERGATIVALLDRGDRGTSGSGRLRGTAGLARRLLAGRSSRVAPLPAGLVGHG